MRVHLISPVFHGYWHAIASALEALGHQVTTTTYDHNATTADRAWHHLRYAARARVGEGALARAQTRRAMTSVNDSRPEIVVVVKGDTLQDPFWDLLDSCACPG